MNSILYNGKTRVENQTNTRVWEDLSLCPETSTRNVIQEFHLSTGHICTRFEEVAGLCRLGGYSDFHNLMGFTSKKVPNNIL